MILSFFGAELSYIVDYRAVLSGIVTSKDGWSRSEAVVSALGGHYMESHATKSYTRATWSHGVCAGGVWVCACRLRVCVSQMRACGCGHGGMWVRVSGSENVTWKFQRACQRFLKRMVSMMEMSSSCRSC